MTEYEKLQLLTAKITKGHPWMLPDAIIGFLKLIIKENPDKTISELAELVCFCGGDKNVVV